MNESNLTEEFAAFRNEKVPYGRIADFENNLKVALGEKFDDHILRLFAIKEILDVNSYLVLLKRLERLNRTPDLFENFLRLSENNQSYLVYDLYSIYVPGMVTLLNLTEVLLVVEDGLNTTSLEDLLDSLENNKDFSRNPYYESVFEHRNVSPRFKDIVSEFCEYVNVDTGEFAFGIDFKDIAYILRNLFGEKHVLEFLERIKYENFTCDSEMLVKMAISYSEYKDHPLEWVEQIASGMTLEDLRFHLSANQPYSQQLIS